MKRELILCFALAGAGGFFGGGASAPCRAAAVAPEGLHFIRIHMVDSKNGWAQAGAPEDHRVVHTANGGVSWVDVTPHTLPNRPWDFQFPSSRIAWISSYNQKTGFLLTTNAGASWVSWAPLVPPDDTHNYFLVVANCRLLNARDGLAECVDGAAGSSCYTFFDTHDGGGTWTPMPGTFSPRDPFSDHKLSFVSPRDIFVENGGTLYVTHDGAQSWRASNLGLGLRETGHDVSQMEFVDAVHGWIAVSGQGGTWASGHRTFYAYATVYETFNGGETWTELPLRVDQEANKREQRDEHQPERNFTQ